MSKVKVGNGEIWICSLGDFFTDRSLGISNAVLTEDQKNLAELVYSILEEFMALN